METSSRNCHIPIVEYLEEEPQKKASYPPGGHHDGSMQTTEVEAFINRGGNYLTSEDAEYNRTAEKRFKALCESMKQTRKEALKDFSEKMAKSKW